MKHDSPDAGRWRFGRALLDLVDKGAGSARRSRDAALRAGNFAAFLRPATKWIEGRANVAEGKLAFVSIDGQSFTIDVVSHSENGVARWLLARRGGFRFVRAHEVELISDDRTVLLALGRRELPVLLTSLG